MLEHLLLRARAPDRELGVAEDHGEDVVEVVGHAPRQRSDGLQLLGLAELLLQPALFLLVPPTIRDVAPRRLQLHEPALTVEDPAVGPLLETPLAGDGDGLVDVVGHGILRSEREDLATDGLAIGLPHQGHEAPAHELVGALPEHAAVGLVDERPPAVRLPANDHLHLVLDHDAEELLLAAQLEDLPVAFVQGDGETQPDHRDQGQRALESAYVRGHLVREHGRGAEIAGRKDGQEHGQAQVHGRRPPPAEAKGRPDDGDPEKRPQRREDSAPDEDEPYPYSGDPGQGAGLEPPEGQIETQALILILLRKPGQHERRHHQHADRSRAPLQHEGAQPGIGQALRAEHADRQEGAGNGGQHSSEEEEAEQLPERGQLAPFGNEPSNEPSPGQGGRGVRAEEHQGHGQGVPVSEVGGEGGEERGEHQARPVAAVVQEQDGDEEAARGPDGGQGTSRRREQPAQHGRGVHGDGEQGSNA